jgi:hypothetical protein
MLFAKVKRGGDARAFHRGGGWDGDQGVGLILGRASPITLFATPAVTQAALNSI